jgi:hypothetical protein
VAEAAATYQADRPLEQGEGDSFILIFADSDNAVAAALELQLAVAKEPWPGGLELKVRMAVHAGDLDRKPDGRATPATPSTAQPGSGPSPTAARSSSPERSPTKHNSQRKQR